MSQETSNHDRGFDGCEVVRDPGTEVLEGSLDLSSLRETQ